MTAPADVNQRLEQHFQLASIDAEHRDTPLNATFTHSVARGASLRIQRWIPVHPLVTFGMIVLAIAGLVGGNVLYSTTSTATAETPTPDQLAQYAVGPDEPRLLSIGDLQMKARVSHASVRNIHDVSWDTNSAKASVDGITVLRGVSTVDGRSAVFARAYQAQIGMTVDIELGDRQIMHYTIRSISPVKLTELESSLKSPVESSPRSLYLVVNTPDGARDTALVIAASADAS